MSRTFTHKTDESTLTTEPFPQKRTQNRRKKLNKM